MNEKKDMGAERVGRGGCARSFNAIRSGLPAKTKRSGPIRFVSSRSRVRQVR